MFCNACFKRTPLYNGNMWCYYGTIEYLKWFCVWAINLLQFTTYDILNYVFTYITNVM
jgi:hypothetical protein